MALVAAAVCPHAPLLVPQLATGTDVELAALRAACTAAVADLLAADHDRVYLVGADGGPRAHSLAPWGSPVPVDVPEPMPLPLLVGGWLTAGRVRSFVAVDPATPAADCADLGRDLAGSAGRVALLVMGDGAVRRNEHAPDPSDGRAAGFDAAAAEALGAGDPAGLLRLDAGLATELLSAGRAPWQVLAGAADGATWQAALRYAGAPYGVGYVVAGWRRAGEAST